MTERRFILTLAALLAAAVAMLVTCGLLVGQTTAPATTQAQDEPGQLFTMHPEAHPEWPAEFMDALPIVAWSHPRQMQLLLGWNRFPTDTLGEKLLGLEAWAKWAKPQNLPLACIDGEVVSLEETPLAMDMVRHTWPDARLAVVPHLPFNRDYLIRYSLTRQGKVDPRYKPLPAKEMQVYEDHWSRLKPAMQRADTVLIGCYLLDLGGFDRDLDYIAAARRELRRKFPGVRIAYVAWGAWHEGWTAWVKVKETGEMLVIPRKQVDPAIHELQRANAPLSAEQRQRYVAALTKNARYGDIVVMFSPEYPRDSELVRALAGKLR